MSCIRKVYTEDGCLTSDPKRIMKEVESIYSKLYQEDNLKPSENLVPRAFLRRGEDGQENVLPPFIASCSKRNIFIGPIVTFVWETVSFEK